MSQPTSHAASLPWLPSRVARASSGSAPRCILHRAPATSRALLVRMAIPLSVAASCTAPTPAPTASDPPAGWVPYASPDGSMIYHPPSWKVCREGPSYTMFSLPDDATFAIGLYSTKCDLASDCGGLLACASKLLDEGLDPARTRKEVSRGTWAAGPTCGCVLEDVVKDQDQGPTYFMQVFLPVEDGRIVVATYYHAGVETVAVAEHELVAQVIATLQPAPNGQVACAAKDTQRE